MSWSIRLIGKPSKISEALDEQSKKLMDTSKLEFDAALPHMQALVKQNFTPEGQPEPIVDLEASGHGVATNGKLTRSNFLMNLKHYYGELCT